MARGPGFDIAMLIWVCALHCEAKPIIDYYRLNKAHDDNAFDHYQSDRMICIVSGSGKIASAAATAWAAAKYHEYPSIAWINLGIAGAAQHAVGSIFLVNKVIDSDTDRVYYPAAISRSGLASASCISLNQPGYDYDQTHLFDMEASGFFYSALRFSSAELIRCIKVISDNRCQQSGRNRQKVSDLIQHHFELIDQQAVSLLEISDEAASREIPAAAWQRVMAMARFSQTQKNRLRVLLRYLLCRSYSIDSLADKIAPQTSAGKMIDILEQLSHLDSRNL